SLLMGALIHAAAYQLGECVRISRRRPNRQLTTAAPFVWTTQAAPGVAFGGRACPAAALRVLDGSLDVLLGMPPPPLTHAHIGHRKQPSCASTRLVPLREMGVTHWLVTRPFQNYRRGVAKCQHKSARCGAIFWRSSNMRADMPANGWVGNR